MKTNIISRQKQFQQDIEKFNDRWQGLKPGRDVLDSGSTQACLDAVQKIKDKKLEFEELEEIKKALQYCFDFDIVPILIICFDQDRLRAFPTGARRIHDFGHYPC